MLRKFIFQVAFFSLFFAVTAFAANTDSVIVPGDLRITGDGNGLVFPDGSMQYKAATQGPSGVNSLISLTDESPGSNCTNGGVKLQVGIDANANGTLDSNEVTQTKFICNGNTPTTGVITGTVTYTGSLGSVSVSKPIIVVMNPYPNAFDNFVANGTTYQTVNLTSSPGTFTFTNVPPGQYHLVAIFDRDSNGVSIGDPTKIYTPGNPAGSNYHADPATAFSVVAGQQYSLLPNISFDDSMWAGQ